MPQVCIFPMIKLSMSHKIWNKSQCFVKYILKDTGIQNKYPNGTGHIFLM